MFCQLLRKEKEMRMMLKDRVDGGKKLAERVLHYNGEPGLIVIGLPRGGVITAHEVAKALDAPLDIVVPRKIGAPFNPELAVGAVTSDGTVLYNEEVMRKLNVPIDVVDDKAEEEKKEAMRRLDLYRGDRPELDLNNKTVILVDDGVATGMTMKAAIMSISLRGAKKIIVAVPVLPADTYENLKEMVDDVQYVLMPEIFYSISQFYEVFPQTTDEEVVALMDKAKRPKH